MFPPTTSDPDVDLRSAWLAAEAHAGPPLVIVLDQAEEVYTRPNAELPNELPAFLATLQNLFADPTQRPRGRLLLSFRKEWLAEIEKQLVESKLAHTKFFLQRLSHAGIVDAVLGPARTPRLRGHFGLTVEDALPTVIADDLLADPESPIATTLQILLVKLWDAATAHNHSRPHFSLTLYQELRRTGILLTDFLDQQLHKLREWRAACIESGLALDVLTFHTTALGTAEQQRLDTVRAAYSHCADLDDLLHQSKTLYLLTDPAADQASPGVAITRLAHDTLAPLVRKRFTESDAPGQRALRILTGRAVDWDGDQPGAPLDETDLALVEAGVAGMRGWLASELALVEASRQARTQRQRAAQRNRKIRQTLQMVVALLFLVAVGLALWANRQRATAVAELNNAQIAESRRLANMALQQLSIDPIASVHLALQALPSAQKPRPYVPAAEFALTQALRANQEIHSLPATLLDAAQVAFYADRIAVGDGQLRLVDHNLTLIATLGETLDGFKGVQWSSDGHLLAYDVTSMTVWQGTEKIAQQDFSPQLAQEGGELSCAVWNPLRNEIAVCAGSAVYVWSPLGDDANSLHRVGAVNTGEWPVVPSVRWSLDGRWLAAWNQQLIIWDSQNQTVLRTELYEDYIQLAVWAANSQMLATVVEGGTHTVQLWPLTPTGEPLLLLDADRVSSVLALDDRWLVWADQILYQFALDGAPRRELPAPVGWPPQDLWLTPDQTELLLTDQNGNASVWPWSSKEKPLTLPQVDGLIMHTAWRPAGDYLATASYDGLPSIWEIGHKEMAESDRLITILPVNGGRLLGMRWLDEQRLLTYQTGINWGSSPGALRIWQVFDEQGRPFCRRQAVSQPPDCTAFSRLVDANPTAGAVIDQLQWIDNGTLLARDWLTDLYRWDRHTGQTIILRAPAENIPVVWNPTGDAVLFYPDWQPGEFWRLEGQTWRAGQPLRTPISYTIWLNAGLLISDATGRVDLLDPATQDRLPVLDEGGLQQAIQLTDALIAIADSMGTIHLWDRLKGSVQTSLQPDKPSRPIFLDASADGTLLLATYQSGEVVLWDRQQDNQPWHPPAEGTGFDSQPARLSPSGRHVAIAQDSSASVVDRSTNRLVWTSQALNPDRVSAVTWRADGARLLLQQDRAHLLAWDEANNTFAHVLALSPRYSVSSWLTPDGTEILTLSEGDGLRLWQVWPDVETLVAMAHACCTARPLSEQQRVEFGLEEGTALSKGPDNNE